MFRSVVTSTPMVGDTPDSYFSNIYGDAFMGDVSFISTLRALVAPRMKSDDVLSIRFHNSYLSAAEVASASDTRAVKYVCDYFDPTECGSVYIHNLNSTRQDDNYACLELIKTTFAKVYNDRGDGKWQILEKLTEFYRKQFYAICFINPEIKSVAIFVDNMDLRKMHYLQCSIFAFLPWYFDPEKGVSELEMSLINSLREKSATKYVEIISKIAEQYDFRAAKIRRLLSGFETNAERMECERVRENIEHSIRNIEDLNSRIGSHLREKNELEIKLLGLERRIQEASSEDSEIMEYFLCNNRLVLLSTSNSHMTFGVNTYIEYFDEDMAASAISNHNSYLYAPDGVCCERQIPKDHMEKLMRAIFIDQVLKIKTCAVYAFDLHGQVTGYQNYNFGYEFNGCMPNPHVNGYSCLGNYTRVINEFLKQRDYIGAIEQCIASAKSLNFGDSTVMSLFARAIYQYNCTYNNKCIELPDKNIVTPKEAIAWLEKQECDSNE